MQPSSGDTSRSAHTPQNANKSATEMMSLLSVERRAGMSSFITSPNSPPSASAARFSSTGFTSVSNEHPPLPPRLASATEIATEYSTSPTTSSSATTCRSVSTKSPFAPVWRMVIIVDAGAVAEASAASTMENASSSRSTK